MAGKEGAAYVEKSVVVVAEVAEEVASKVLEGEILESHREVDSHDEFYSEY